MSSSKPNFNTTQFDKFKRRPVKINCDEPLEYNSYAWEETDYTRPFSDDDLAQSQYFNRNHNKEYMIFNFGVTLEGHSVCSQIRGYKPYFYIMIPQEFNDKQRQDLLDALDADTIEEIDPDIHQDQLTNKDRFYSQFYKSAIVQDRVEIVNREIFWKFTNHAKFDFIRLVFHSQAAMKFYYRALSKPIDLSITGLYRKLTKYNLFEADMEPLLRYYHDQKLKPSGWVRLDPGTYATVNKVARTQIAVTVQHNNVIPIEKDAIAPLRIAAFDIEADSSHGDFPVAQKDCQKLAMQLVMAWFRDKLTLSKYGTNDPRSSAAQSRISMGSKFFSDRIKKAVQLIPYTTTVDDDDIDFIYLRGCYNDSHQTVMQRKCHSPAFELMINEIFFICDRELTKITANQQLKRAIKIVEAKEKRYLERLRPGQIFSMRNYIDIINNVAKDQKLDNPQLLQKKMVDKNQLVRFVNNQLNRFFGKPYGDRCIQIGTVFWTFGDAAPYHNNILTLQGCAPFNVGDEPCDIRTFTYKHEAAANIAETKLLLAWSKLIRDYDPDIITGYNIHGFDMAFMYDRALDIICDITGSGSTTELSRDEQYKIRNNPKYQDFISLGKLHPDIIKRCPDMRGRLINKKLSSSALGDNFLFYFNTPGRVQIDLLKVCQNSLDKLPSYKLDDVASYYISGKITHVLPSDLDLTTVIDKWAVPGGPRDQFLESGGDDQKQAFADYLAEYVNNHAKKTGMTESTRLMVKGTKEIDDGNFVVVNMSTTGQQLYDGDKIAVTNIQRSAASIPILQKDGTQKPAILETICLEKPVPIDSLVSYPKWGLAKDDVSPKDIFELQKGSDNDRAVVAKYCIQDCVLLIRLLKKLEVITNNFGMSNVSLIPFAYIFLRGQGIKIFSLVVNECSQAGFVLPTLEKVYPDEEELGEGAHILAYNSNNVDNTDNEDDNTLIEKGNEEFQLKSNFNVIPMTEDSYEGAIVLVPKPGIYFEPITVLDFSSLYPSEMIASDLSHDRIVEDECWLGDDGKARLYELGYDVLDVTYDNLVWVDPKNKNKGKRKEGTRTVRFVQPHNGEKGLIPRILQKLLGARKATKKLMKKESDPFRYTLLDGLQLAYKLTANSLYGQIGAKTSKIYKQEIAASTTAGGRRNIYLAKDYCLEKNPGCDVVYGDTDSVFVKLNLSYKLDPPPKTTDPAGREYPDTKLEKIKRSMEIGFWLQAKLKEDKVFKPPHDLEYEKVYYPLILITKKRYIGIKFEFDPEEGKKTSMGVVTKRRDNAPILKHTFIGVVDTLMKERDIAKAVKFVQDTCRSMIDEQFDLNMFVISKTLREYYKDPESIAHKVLAMRMGERDPGNKPSSNSRIPYVFIKIDEKPGVRYLQGDRIEHVTYVRDNKCSVDYEVYIKKQIMKPVSQIFELVVDQIPGYPYPGDNGEHFYNLENIYYNKFKGDLKKTAKKISDLKQNMIHKIVFGDLINYAINKYTGQKTIIDMFKTIPAPNTSKITILDTPKNITPPKKRTTLERVKKEKQTTLSSFFKK